LCRAISLSTASSAMALPWISERTATRMDLLGLVRRVALFERVEFLAHRGKLFALDRDKFTQRVVILALDQVEVVDHALHLAAHGRLDFAPQAVAHGGGIIH